MSSEDLLGSLFFTRSTGATTSQCNEADDAFFDAITVGKYPSEQRILKIVRIEVFNTLSCIQGMRVTYRLHEGDLVTVNHGNVSAASAGVLNVSDNELLVGACGQLKATPSDRVKDGRISTIQFVVYNRDSGFTRLDGPFGGILPPKVSWGCYGPILALESTVGEDGNLSSIGFTRLIQGVPSFGILGGC